MHQWHQHVSTDGLNSMQTLSLGNLQRIIRACGPADATATPSSLASVKPEWCILVLAYPGCPGKKAVKRMCVCVCSSAKHKTRETSCNKTDS